MIILDTKNPTSKAFSLIYNSFLEMFKADDSLKKPDVFLKVFRTAILADTLYQEGNRKVLKDDNAKNQILSLLFESFILYVRIIYDLSTDIIQTYSDKTVKKSYNDLLSKILKNKIDGIDEDLHKHIIKHSDKFVDLKNIRDSIKRNATADIYVKNKTLFVFLKYYDKKNKKYKILDEELSMFVFLQSVILCILAGRLKEMIVKNKKI